MNEEVFKYKKALIIDDSEMDLMVNEMILKTTKFAKEIIKQSTGRDGLKYLNEVLEQNPDALPDFILLDINMPLMNGYEFLDHFEKEEQFKKCKVAVISSSEDLEDLQKVSFYKSVSGYLIKPLDLNSLNNF